MCVCGAPYNVCYIGKSENKRYTKKIKWMNVLNFFIVKMKLHISSHRCHFPIRRLYFATFFYDGDKFFIMFFDSPTLKLAKSLLNVFGWGNILLGYYSTFLVLDRPTYLLWEHWFFYKRSKLHAFQPSLFDKSIFF